LHVLCCDFMYFFFVISAAVWHNKSSLLAMAEPHLSVATSGNLGYNYPDMVLYVPIGLYCEPSSLLDNSEIFVTFCKRKLA